MDYKCCKQEEGKCSESMENKWSKVNSAGLC